MPYIINMSEARKLDFELLTKDELAEVLGVTSRTVHSYIKRGIAPATTVVGGSVRFRSDVVADWLISRTGLPVLEPRP